MNTKIKVFEKIKTDKLTQFVALAGLATILPFYIHQQWITGPIINAILIITLILVGLREAIIVSFVPSAVALFSGLLPFLMAPVVPFIMLSNVVLVISLEFIRKKITNEQKGYWSGILLGSFLKFLFLLLSVQILSKTTIKAPIVQKIAVMFSWPQFYTAILGGVIAWVFLNTIRKQK